MPNNIRPGVSSSVYIGGRTITDNGNLKILYAAPSSGAGVRSTARLMGAKTGAGYQVPVGKTFQIKAFRAFSQSAAADNFGIAQVDADTGLTGAATAFTNPVYAGSGSTTVDTIGSIPSGIGQTIEVAIEHSIAAQKFIGVQCGGSAELRVLIYGYEV